jgi:energy-coupling factor transporter ATP-binding protein EcfA2
MSASAVRVVSLQASNILRLSAVEFSWKDGQRVLTLGGANGAGKSSVINAVAMALGGMSLCPDEPLKRGEQRGFVEVNLGELIVRREFWRDLLNEQPADGTPAYGETKSRLIVKNTEGIKQEPAQRLLDRLIGKLSFDPTAFAADDGNKQAETLRKIVGLDFKDHDEQRSIAYDRRAVYSRQAKEQLVILDNMVKYDDVPDEELSLSALLDQLREAHDKKKRAADLLEVARMRQLDIDSKERQLKDLEVSSADIDRQIIRLQQERTEKQAAASELAADIDAIETARDVAANDAKTAESLVPDDKVIQAQIADVEDTNSKIRANAARKNVMNTVAKNQKQAEEQDQLIAQLDETRAKTIRETKFPIDGLGISHTGAVTFNGIALKQASTAEQMRVSVAIGFALNPALKLLCIRNGNALDDTSFALIAELAERAGGQVLMEVVTKKADDVSVFIEDGHNG